MFSSGGVLVSAGGTELKVWDVLSGGRLLHCAANHQKTIQSLCLHEESARLMSGGLDGQLKVYDTTDYKVTQNMKFPQPIVAQQLSPDRRHLVVGMLNGLLAIRKRDVGSAAADTDGETVRIPPTPTHLRVPAAAIARFLDSYAHFANAWRRGRASASSR
jgi:WD40 repeat protein